MTGTRITEHGTPAFASKCQNGVPRRMPRMIGFPRGSEYLPMRSCRLGPVISAD